MTRTFIVSHEPWDALCLARVLPDAPVATFGNDRLHAAFEQAGLPEPLFVPAGDELRTTDLLADPRVAAAIAAQPSSVLCFKPSARLEQRAAELGASLAHAPARIGQGLENKLALAEVVEEAGVPAPAARRATAATSWTELTEALGPRLVVQVARSFAGKGTWPVDSEQRWSALAAELGRRPLRVTERLDGTPGTAGVVVDAHGRVVVTSAILQVTGHPRLSPTPLGSCGNDFTWRPGTDPSEQVAAMAKALGPVLAGRGYQGHFGIDFLVAASDGGVRLIEINARLTASFGLYSTLDRSLLDAHFEALSGGPIEPRLLPPVPGGQLIWSNGGTEPAAPPTACGWWPSPSPNVGVAARLARWVVDGEVVGVDGSLAVDPFGDGTGGPAWPS